jgi:ferric-dicitrate binding protein FerR (iron transport regulator)
LNSASSIRYPVSFAGTERRVEITGEVYFEVSKDARKPFRVVGDKVEIEVLGTKFNVNAYQDETMVRTTLFEGKVKVSSIVNGQLSEDKAFAAVLKPGEQAILASHSPLPDGTLVKAGLTIHDNVDVGDVMAWKNGLFHFENADMKTVMRQLSRWYDVEVV